MCHPQSETLAEAALGPPPLEPPPCTQAPPAWKQRVQRPPRCPTAEPDISLRLKVVTAAEPVLQTSLQCNSPGHPPASFPSPLHVLWLSILLILPRHRAPCAPAVCLVGRRGGHRARAAVRGQGGGAHHPALQQTATHAAQTQGEALGEQRKASQKRRHWHSRTG